MAPSSPIGGEPLLLPHRAHLVRLPDEVGGAVDRRDEVGRHGRLRRRRRAVALPAVGRRLGIDALAAPLGGGVDARLRDGVQRPLGEGRERAHLLDLVSEQLHAQRLASGRREDVDDASANGELAALVDPVDALVAGARKGPGEAVEAGLLADHEPHRLRPRRPRRHPLGERRRRGADEPAGGEDVERTGALADEVRRRLEARRVRDAAAREQGHPVGAEEPRCTLGRIPRVGVLGQEDQQAAAELLVERRQHERERRLRHARPARAAPS